MRYVEVGSWWDRTPPAGSVVVGYDGKEHSRAAVTWAAREAARRGAPLLVLYAAHYSGMTLGPGPGLLHRDPGALEAAQEVTAEGVELARDAVPGLVVLGATEVTSPTEALVQAAGDAALVVVGTRGHGPILGTVLGSVGSRVTARAAAPVVVVTDEAARPVR